MKVNIEIDCTPLEARQFFGLPDVAADADGGDGQAAAADDGQHRQGLAGIADADLVHLRSEDRRAVSGHVRDHGRSRRRSTARTRSEWRSTRGERTAAEQGGFVRRVSLLLLAEARALFEFNASLLLSPLLMRAPRGDGHPVLALPGFLASDLSMAPMRRYLKELGYDAHAWNMGRNIGGVSQQAQRAARPAGADLTTTAAARSASSAGASAASMRAIWRCRRPTWCASVITLGSPFANDIRATNATRLYEAAVGRGRRRQSGASAKRSPAICRCRPRRSIPAPTAS